MEDKDFNRIEQMMFAVVDAKFSQFKREIVEEFDHRLGLQNENFQHRLDLIVEGHQLLTHKLEETGTELKAEIGKVDRRVTAIAADLTAHRADTEAHHGVYRVKESRE